MRRRTRRILLVLLGGAALALLVGMALIVQRLREEVAPARVAARLAERLDLPVAIDAVRPRWLPPSLVLEGVDAGPALRVGRVRADVALLPLLRGRALLEELHARDAELALRLPETGAPVLASDAPGGTPLPLDLAAREEEPGARVPELHLRNAAIVLEDAAGARPPLHIAVRELHLDALRVLGRTQLRAELALGADGALGRLSLHGRGDTLPGRALGEDAVLRATLAARGLDLAALRPWLPEDWPLRSAEDAAPLDLDLDLEGAWRDALDVGLSMEGGALGVGPLVFRAPAELEGRLRPAEGGGLAFEDARLEAAGVEGLGVRARGLRARFALRRDLLEVASLHVEDAGAEDVGAGGAGPFGVDLHLRGAEQLVLEGLVLGGARLRGLRRVEARDVALVVEPADETRAGALPLRIERLAFAERGGDGAGHFELALRTDLEEGGRPGTLRARGRLGGPGAQEAPLDARPLRVVLEAQGLPVAPLAPVLPPRWRTRAAQASRVSGEATLEGARAAALAGPLRLALASGRLGLGDLTLDAPAELHAILHVDPLALADATARAAGVALGAARGEAAEARFAFRDGTWRVERAAAEALRAEPPLRLGAAPGEGAALALHGARQVVLHQLTHRGRDAGEDGKAADGTGASPEAERTAARDAPPPLPERVAFEDADLEVALALTERAPPLRVHAGRLEASGLRRGGEAELRLEGALSAPARGAAGRTAAPGRLDVRAVLAPFARDLSFARALRVLEVSLEDADVAHLAEQLPPELVPERSRGRLGATLRLGAEGHGAAQGPLELTLREGSVRIAAFRVPAPATASAQLRVTRQGTVVAGAASLRLRDGRVRQRGELVMADPPRIDAVLELEDVALYDILVAGESFLAHDPPPHSPHLRGALRVRGPFGEGEERFAVLRGAGEATAEGGELPSSELLASVAGALARRVGVPLEADEGRRTALERASARVRLEDGHLVSDDLEMRTREYVLRGRGRMSLEGELALDTEVSFLPAGVSRLLSVLAVTRPVLGDLLSLPPVPVTVEGELADPRFVVDPARLPGTWVRTLLELPGRALDQALETGRRIGRGLGDLLGGEGEEEEEGDGPEEQAPPDEETNAP